MRPFVAITGTNGKSTTTALIAHILRSAGRDVQMGGNIGVAILSLQPPARERVHVIEMSSYQIDLAPTLKPTIGMLLNVTPDHLDRHGSMQSYAAIKERAVTDADVAVIAVDDAYTRAVAERREKTGRPTSLVSAETSLDRGFFMDGSCDHARQRTHRRPRRHPDLARTAQCAERSGGGGRGARPRRADGRYSAWTADVPGPAAPAGGGRTQRQGALCQQLQGDQCRFRRQGAVVFSRRHFLDSRRQGERGRHHVADALFPEDRQGLSDRRGERGIRRRAGRAGALRPLRHPRCRDRQSGGGCGGFPAAEPIVLLSPACASFDQYRNFEIRGDHFRKLVQALV